MSTNTALDQIKARVEGHTEGPWVVMTNSVCHERNKIWHRVATNTYGPTAELIAAAPKLLAALEAVEEMAGGMNCASKDHAYGTWDHGYNTALRSAATLIREVIEEALR